MNSIERNMASENRVPLRQLLVFGAGGFIPIALFNIAGQLVGLIGNISLGLSAFWLGAILIIPRLWDAMSDPIIGHISDHTRTRWGRRRPFILIGGIAVALSFVMLWWVPKQATVQTWFPSESAFEWFQLSYILLSLLIFFTACTFFEIPHGALGIEMAPNSHERTRLFSAKSFFGNLFAMATPWIFALAGLEIFKGTEGTEADGMRSVSILIALVLIPSSVWWFMSLREPALVELPSSPFEKKSRFWTDIKYVLGNKNFLLLVGTVFTLAMGFNFVSLLNYYISIFYLYGGDKSAAGVLLGINGTVWAIAGLLAVFPLNWLAPRLGKHKIFVMAIGLMCVAQLTKIYCYNPSHPYLVVIPTILLSTGMLFFFTLSTSMLGDVCDEDELKTGKRAEGSYYSVYWWFIKMGTAFASLVTGLLIFVTQFDEEQVTHVDELRGSINIIRNAVESGGHSSQREDPLVIEKQLLEVEKKTLAFSLQIHNHITSFKISPSSDSPIHKPIQAELQTLADRNAARAFSLNTLLSELKSLPTFDSTDRLKDIVDRFTTLSLTLRIDQAALNASTLKLHFLQKVPATHKDGVHREMLMQNLTLVQNQLASLVQDPPPSLESSPSIESAFPPVEQALSQLTRQAPHSLLLMRLIEITLPILLSLFSLLFALKYPLTNQRCQEIQRALMEKNKSMQNKKLSN